MFVIGNFNEQIEKVYKFIKELGEGAFGKVFLIENIKTKQTFACKRLAKIRIKDLDKINPSKLARFLSGMGAE